MLIKYISFVIFFFIFIFFSSFYPQWGSYFFYTGPNPNGTENFILDIVALLFSAAIGALSYVSLQKIRDYFLVFVEFLRRINQKNKNNEDDSAF